MNVKKKKFKISKNIILSVVLIFLFGVCWYINRVFVGEDVAKILGQAEYVNNEFFLEEDVFSESRMKVTEARHEKIAQLKEIIGDENSDEETKKLSREELMTVTKNIEDESICEEQIKLKLNLTDVFVNVNVDYATVNIKSGELTEMELAQIKEIIISKTGVDISAIKISLTN